MRLSHLHQKPIRVLFPLFGALLPLFLGGCQSAESALRENKILRNAAHGVLTGKAYDRITIARRNQDSKAIKAAAAELSKLDPQGSEDLVLQSTLQSAEVLVEAAQNFDITAEKTESTREKHKLRQQATQKYREALELSPEFPSKDPQLLNSLGYFLADRGNTKKDFQTAEKLTRQSLKQWDAMLEQLKKVPLTEKARAQVQFVRALTAQDSLAWALFKQGKLEEAAKEQQDAIKTSEQTASLLNEKVSAELYYHYAEIERARGHLDIARTNYQIALQLEPGHQPSLDALRTLGPSKSPAPEKPTPQPEEIPRRLSPDAQLT